MKRAWRDDDGGFRDFIFRFGIVSVGILAVLCASAFAADREPSYGLVKITQDRGVGSGVCVTPDGFVLTVAHVVDQPSPVFVTFDKEIRSYTGAVVYRDKRADLAVVKVESETPFPCIPVADATPVKGEQVWSEGYPSGQYARMEGSVAGISNVNLEGGIRFNPEESVQAISTTHRVQAGNSGGPLFNKRGEVVGVAHGVPVNHRDISSIFVGTVEIHTALTKCGAKGWKSPKNPRKLLPKGYIFVSDECKWCHVLLADLGGKKKPPAAPQLRAFLEQHFRVRVVKVKNAKKLIKKYSLTGALPAFLASNIPAGALYGYSGPDQLIEDITKALELAPQTEEMEFQVGPDDGVELDYDLDPFFDTPDLEGEEMAQAEPAPLATRRLPPKAPSVPAPKAKEEGFKMESVDEEEEKEPEITDADLRTLTGVLLVNDFLGDGLAGKGVALMERAIEGRLLNELAGMIGGDRAKVRVIFRRLHPETFDAVCEKGMLTGQDKVAFVVLVPSLFPEGLTGKLAAFLEEKAKGLKDSLLKDLPLFCTFQRTDETTYTGILAALETLSKPGDSESKIDLKNPLTWVGVGGSGVVGWVIWLLSKMRGDQNKLVLKVHELASKDKPK